MPKTNSKTSFPFFSKHNFIWKMNHLKILRALNSGCKTYYEIYLATNLTHFTIRNHKKEIVKCPSCEQHVNKERKCFFCLTVLQ